MKRILNWSLATVLSQIPLFQSSIPDLDDQSWIQRWTAVGDSYASGLGTGLRLDYGCSRYAGGYPNLMETDERFGLNPNRTFQYLACSGLKSTEILTKQVPHVLDNQDLITISAGGNDVALGDVLDSCIFQWKHGNSARCDAALVRSQELIDTVLETNVDLLIDSLVTKLSPNGRIYYPGYAQFFGDSVSCNNISWSVWPRMPPSDRQNLTIERRVRMNHMVSQVNKKLKQSIDKAGENVIFIDWDWTFAQAGGRFCENGTREPAPQRQGLLFFEWNTMDDGDDPNLLIRPGDPVPSDSFEGDIGKWVLETLTKHPDWQFGPVGTEPIAIYPAVMERLIDSQGLRAQLGFDDYVFWFLPDSWKRVFHPRALGQRLIADMIIHAMAVEKANMVF
ncbi:SGNH hydrolase [Microthyrium microscopicum]|uniref:SGNH hydrolase n=1 Tax=Microthyrium microscopicum TaxID=703497 RepID=A0A6A6U681_9PEZI|nr:SGNH hydrolase [Microthyrium microscopicum]